MSSAPAGTDIAFLLPDLRGGGAERVCIELAKEYSRLGARVHFVLMSARGELLDEARAIAEVVDLQVSRARKIRPGLSQYLRRRPPSLLIASMWPLTVTAVLARLMSSCQCRLILVEHCSLTWQYASWGWLHRLMLRASVAATYRFADARVGVSNGVANDLAQVGLLPAGSCHAVPNPVRVGTVDPEGRGAAERFWAIPPGFRVLTVGTLKKEKNHALLMRAFARLPLPAQLVIAGTGACEPELRDLAAQLNIGDRVIFAGFQRDPAALYASADLFVLSSDHEGFGNVIVEALASGTPVVATDCPFGPREILANGEFGTLVPVRDVEALSTAIFAALTRGHDPQVLRRRALEYAPDVTAKRYLELAGMTLDVPRAVQA